MMQKLTALIRLIPLACALALPAIGAARDDQPRTEAGEARIALTNTLIQEVKSGRQATFGIRWDYLPESLGFKERFLNVFTFDGKGKIGYGQDYDLPNEYFREPGKLDAWFADLKKNKREGPLVRALSRGALSTAVNLEEAVKRGEIEWQQSLFEGLGFVEGRGSATVRWQDYITAKQDFFAMRHLFTETKGAGAILEFDPAPRGENPLLLSNGLVWHIKVFPLETSASKPAEAGAGGAAPPKPKPLYRFSVSIDSKPIKKLFRGTSDQNAPEKPKLTVTVGLLVEKQDPDSQRLYYRFAKVSIAKDGTTVDTEAMPGADQLKEVDSTLSPSTGATGLEIFTGQTPKGLLGPLIANNSEAQFYTGGLVGNGAPTSVYGLNYIFTDLPDGNLGFIYGFVPKTNNSLFLGPSLSVGPFILGAGIRVFNRSDESVSAKFAATLSLDLARAFGKRVEPIHLNPTLEKPGSEIWADSDLLWKDKQLLLCRVQGPAGESIAIKYVKDELRNPIADGFTRLVGVGMTRLVLPRGYFTITPPEGYQIVEQVMKSEEPVTAPASGYEDSATLVTVRDRPEAIIYVLKKKG